jgi:uncharacterized cupin superfamily protein
VPDEAPLIESEEGGLVPDGDGWFVVGSREARWLHNDDFGAGCVFEGEERFRQLGINVSVIQPGQPLCYYHRENAQENFLVLAGECLLLIEEQERPLRAWDFVHCPAETSHVIVGAGDGPAVVVAIGARPEEWKVVYPVSELARRHNAGVETETTTGREAYANGAPTRRGLYREGDLPDLGS